MRIRWQLLALIMLTAIVGAVLALQRQANGELRTVMGLLREQNQEVERLRVERTRLLQAQVSATELENLRSDHAAVERLRSEIEVAKARVTEMEHAESAPSVRH